ncbi:MAG: AMP-binding protein, partial [Pseudomonas putida]
MNLGKIITRSARYWPDHIAVADSQTRVSYAQLERRSNRLASGLVSLGVAVGEHVAILAANRVELVEAEVALYKAAMVKVPINARLSLDEVVRVLEDSCSVALITDASFAQALATRRAELPLLRQLIVLEGEGGDLGYAALLERGSEAALGLDPADDA